MWFDKRCDLKFNHVMFFLTKGIATKYYELMGPQIKKPSIFAKSAEFCVYIYSYNTRSSRDVRHNATKFQNFTNVWWWLNLNHSNHMSEVFYYIFSIIFMGDFPKHLIWLLGNWDNPASLRVRHHYIDIGNNFLTRQ